MACPLHNTWFLATVLVGRRDGPVGRELALHTANPITGIWDAGIRIPSSACKASALSLHAIAPAPWDRPLLQSHPPFPFQNVVWAELLQDLFSVKLSVLFQRNSRASLSRASDNVTGPARGSVGTIRMARGGGTESTKPKGTGSAWDCNFLAV